VGKLVARGAGLNGLTLQAVDGKLEAKLSVRGFSMDATVTPIAKNGRVALTVDQLPDSIPSAVRELVQARLSRGISLPKLPYDASLKEVAVEGGSVVLIATAAGLKLTS